MTKKPTDSFKSKDGLQGSQVDPLKHARPSTPTHDRSPAVAGSAEIASDVADFLGRVKSLTPSAVAGRAAGERGRLIFAMDATMSRQSTWDMALGLQADMFATVDEIGGLDVQLMYFRGHSECRASKWVSEASALARLMTTVDCRGGHTQIGKVLTHARRETETRRVNALVFVGDALEEDVDDLCQKAGELAVHGLPVFLFQEGRTPTVTTAFREMARITGGAHCRFEPGAAAQLRDLLTAVAVYASGGRQALAQLSAGRGGDGARLLLEQME